MVSIDYNRSKVVDFSVPYMFDPAAFVTMMPEKTLPPFILFSPFTPDLWIFVAFFIFIYYIICKLILKLNLKFLDGISQGLNWTTWTVLTLFYSSNLESVVSSPKARDLIDSVSQLLASAKEHKVVPLVIRGGREWVLFKDPEGMYNDIGKQMVGCKNNREAFKKLIESNPNEIPKALITAHSIIEAKAKILGSHHFHQPRDTLHFDFCALAIRKGLGWKQSLDVV